MNKDILKYNQQFEGEDFAICTLLMQEIDKNLPKAESKIWHAHPVWFIDGNPIVGYHKLKNCIRILFWSGQSFETEGLDPEGKFKAAEKRYTEVKEIKKGELKKWLQESKNIQWDYKNIVKRKGKLIKISTIDHTK